MKLQWRGWAAKEWMGEVSDWFADLVNNNHQPILFLGVVLGFITVLVADGPVHAQTMDDGECQARIQAQLLPENRVTPRPPLETLFWLPRSRPNTRWVFSGIRRDRYRTQRRGLPVPPSADSVGQCL